jgi:hypothetical protein
MKPVLLCFFLLTVLGSEPVFCQITGPGGSGVESAKPAHEDAGEERQLKTLANAIKLGRNWQDAVKSGAIDAAFKKLWGYSAIDGSGSGGLRDSLQAQYDLLGHLKYCELLTERCQVDLQENSLGEDGREPGVYATLIWLTEFEHGMRRETMILHEPETKGEGLKIIGLRREAIPEGRQAAAELAAGLGQLALLKLRGAPRERWEPWQREAAALAANLKVSLPEIPVAANSGDAAAGEKLAALIMTAAPPVFDKLGPGGGAHEARAILNAFALLLLYQPGDETITRLAVLAGAEAEKAKLPGDLWKPLIRAVSEKEEFPAVYETVQRLSAGISIHLANQDLAARIAKAPRLILDQALITMEALPAYKVRAEFTADDARKCLMEASLAPGAMYLRLTGFDGRKESRLVNKDGFFISSDEEKTWRTDSDPESARGLCRTLQTPLERNRKFTEKHAFTLTGMEKQAGEQLFRFHSPGAGTESAMDYWVLMSENGPVIRRAQMRMKFGDITADGILTYTKLGKEPEIPALESIPGGEK